MSKTIQHKYPPNSLLGIPPDIQRVIGTLLDDNSIFPLICTDKKCYVIIEKRYRDRSFSRITICELLKVIHLLPLPFGYDVISHKRTVRSFRPKIVVSDTTKITTTNNDDITIENIQQATSYIADHRESVGDSLFLDPRTAKRVFEYRLYPIRFSSVNYVSFMVHRELSTFCRVIVFKSIFEPERLDKSLINLFQCTDRIGIPIPAPNENPSNVIMTRNLRLTTFFINWMYCLTDKLSVPQNIQITDPEQYQDLINEQLNRIRALYASF